MFREPVARAGSSTLPLLHSCPSPLCICVSPPLSIARNATLVHTASSACAQQTVGLALGCLGSESSRWLYNCFPPSSSRLRPGGNKISRCTRTMEQTMFFFEVYFFFQFKSVYQGVTSARGVRNIEGGPEQSCQGTLQHEGTIPTGTLRYKVP